MHGVRLPELEGKCARRRPRANPTAYALGINHIRNVLGRNDSVAWKGAAFHAQ